MSRINGGKIDKIPAHAEGTGAGFEKTFRSLQGHATGWDQLKVRKRCKQRFEIAGPADGRAGKYLHVVGARIPRGDGLSGCKSTGDGDFLRGLRGSDDLRMKTGADDELSARRDGGLSLSRCGNGACA